MISKKLSEMFRLPPQYYNNGELVSSHGGQIDHNIIDELSFVLFLYPRDWTPVCTEEILEINKKQDRFKYPVFVGSANMPEAHAAFYSELALDGNNVTIPVLTVTKSILDLDFANKYASLLFNEYDTTNRVTIICHRGEFYIKEGNIEFKRNIDAIVEEVGWLSNQG